MIKAMGNGRFVRDPELRTVKGELKDTVVVNFTLAVDEYKKNSTKDTHFFDFQVWDSAAEVIEKHCQKGTHILFQAIPRQHKWEDSSTGQKRSRAVFRLEEFTILDHKKMLPRPEEQAVE